MQHKGIRNKSEIARAGGVSASAISQILTGDTKTLKSSTALLIAEFCGVNAGWLSDGVGSMLPDGVDPASSPASGSASASIVDQLVARGWSIEALADLCEVNPKRLMTGPARGALLASTVGLKLVDLYRLNVTLEQMRRIVGTAVEPDGS